MPLIAAPISECDFEQKWALNFSANAGGRTEEGSNFGVQCFDRVRHDLMYIFHLAYTYLSFIYHEYTYSQVYFNI